MKLPAVKPFIDGHVGNDAAKMRKFAREIASVAGVDHRQVIGAYEGVRELRPDTVEKIKKALEHKYSDEVIVTEKERRGAARASKPRGASKGETPAAVEAVQKPKRTEHTTLEPRPTTEEEARHNFARPVCDVPSGVCSGCYKALEKINLAPKPDRAMCRLQHGHVLNGGRIVLATEHTPEEEKEAEDVQPVADEVRVRGNGLGSKRARKSAARGAAKKATAKKAAVRKTPKKAAVKVAAKKAAPKKKAAVKKTAAKKASKKK